MTLTVVNEHPRIVPQSIDGKLYVYSGEVVNLKKGMLYSICTSCYFKDLPKGIDMIFTPAGTYMYRYTDPDFMQNVLVYGTEDILIPDGVNLGYFTPVLTKDASTKTSLKFYSGKIKFNIINKNI